MNIAVYCGSNMGVNPAYSEVAHKLGAWIGKQGHTLIYGGSSVGLMGIISESVLAAGGKVYGVEPQYFIDAGVAQQHLTKLITVKDMSERKAKMIELARVFIALPGGVGTLEEISEIFSRIRLGMNGGPCFCLNIDGFYDGLKQLIESMLAQHFIEEYDFDWYQFPQDLSELTAALVALSDNPPENQGIPRVPESNLRNTNFG